MKFVTRNRVIFLSLFFLIFITVFFFGMNMEQDLLSAQKSEDSGLMFNLNQLNSQQRQKLGEKVRSKKIFFAHMSVGQNIIDGLQLLGQQYPELQLNIVETDDPGMMTEPGFYHTRLGFNSDPASKIDVFQEKVQKVRSAEPDIAFMKFCYVDITAAGNSGAMFEKYLQDINQLQEQNPEIRFVHTTCPLTAAPVTTTDDIKDKIKFFIGKSTGTDDNIARQVWNERLISAYPDEIIFDIAKYESHNPTGQLVYRQRDEKKVPFMNKGYTHDGGHLNKRGRTHLAGQLLLFLAE